MHRIAAFAGERWGVFALAHAAMLDISERTVHLACERGEIEMLYAGVYRFVAAGSTWQGDLLAACWAGGFRAVASHRSAAGLHGLPGGRDDLVEVTCPRWRRTRHPGIEVHEMLGVDPERDATVVDGIPVASVPLTLLGLAAVRPGVVELSLEAALRKQLTTLADVGSLLSRLGGRGRPGAARLRRLLEMRDPALRPSASEMETMLFAALRRHGLPEPERQVPVVFRGRTIATLDGGWPAYRVGYEYDSDEFHTGRVATAADSSRRHHVTAAGWVVVTVVRPDLRAGGTLACMALAELLRQRSDPAVA